MQHDAFKLVPTSAAGAAHQNQYPVHQSWTLATPWTSAARKGASGDPRKGASGDPRRNNNLTCMPSHIKAPESPCVVPMRTNLESSTFQETTTCGATHQWDSQVLIRLPNQSISLTVALCAHAAQVQRYITAQWCVLWYRGGYRCAQCM